MAIPIPTDPGGEVQGGQMLGTAQEVRIAATLLPGLPQAFVVPVESPGEDLAEVVDDSAALGLEIGSIQRDLPGPPEPLESGLDIEPDALLLGGCPHRILAPHQQKIEEPMLLEDREALGLGGMGGEDRSDPQAGQGSGDPTMIQTGCQQPRQAPTPQTGLPGQAIPLLPTPAGLGCRVLLDHGQELEADREDLEILLVEINRMGPPQPGQDSDMGTLALFLEDLPEGLQEPAQIGIDLADDSGDAVRGRSGGHAGANQGRAKKGAVGIGWWM